MVPVIVAISVAWAVWAIPFFRTERGGPVQKIDKRARWGIVLEGVGFAFVWSQWRLHSVRPLRKGDSPHFRRAKRGLSPFSIYQHLAGDSCPLLRCT